MAFVTLGILDFCERPPNLGEVNISNINFSNNIKIIIKKTLARVLITFIAIQASKVLKIGDCHFRDVIPEMFELCDVLKTNRG